MKTKYTYLNPMDANEFIERHLITQLLENLAKGRWKATALSCMSTGEGIAIKKDARATILKHMHGDISRDQIRVYFRRSKDDRECWIDMRAGHGSSFMHDYAASPGFVEYVEKTYLR